uniref:Uncharacterized protein n=1 Tax=Arundo donax TaxID=35708 RepID=A0A0A9GQ88_ARUDO
MHYSIREHYENSHTEELKITASIFTHATMVIAQFVSTAKATTWSDEVMLWRSRWICFEIASRSLGQPVNKKEGAPFQQGICSVLQKFFVQ